MFKNLLYAIFIALGVSGFTAFFAQDSTGTTTESTTEIYLIESFVPVEAKTEFHLGFYTSEACKSKIIVAGKYEFPVSDILTENHKSKINISSIPTDTLFLPFVIVVENESGIISSSEQYELQIPAKNEVPLAESSGGEFAGCLFGAAMYAIPTIDYNFYKGKSTWGLSKELPIVSFYNRGYNFPTHYIAVEYSYVNDVMNRNLGRLGWKYIYDLSVGEFLILGINGVTDFKGYNGISPDISWGLYSFNDVYTLYARYRYSTNFSATARDCHTISLGLCTWFFSVHK